MEKPKLLNYMYGVLYFVTYLTNTPYIYDISNYI